MRIGPSAGSPVEYKGPREFSHKQVLVCEGQSSPHGWKLTFMENPRNEDRAEKVLIFR